MRGHGACREGEDFSPLRLPTPLRYLAALPLAPAPLPFSQVTSLPLIPVPTKAMLVGLENRIDAQNFEIGVLNLERTEMRKVGGRAVRQSTSVRMQYIQAGHGRLVRPWPCAWSGPLRHMACAIAGRYHSTVPKARYGSWTAAADEVPEEQDAWQPADVTRL